ncbi:gliding motility-associated C-terminal domain-containing protein [Aquimarina celericrescens]|uniref:Gliding motility-associated C-terminal domain-containing protein n=1 Tax=Aquimarina celericrescens TaxID=1964542 RepID=A0ABW5ATD5_9FLAO|nr:gliding motility-associated C-terminal domain-containing protein [Aquimarina celericrescens]
MRKKLNLISSIVCLTIFLFSSIKANGQFTIQGPEFYPCNTPTTCNSDNSNKNACVNQNSPNRAAIVRDITRTFPIDTEFILELSDADGTFSDTPLILTRFTTPVAISQNSDIDFNTPFPIPTNLSSDNYSMRVRAIIPGEDDIFSGESTEMSIAYFDSSNPITVNGVSAIGLCSGETVTLTATPSDFPEYQWAIDTDLTDNFVVIPGETGPTLSDVNQTGRYRVRIPLPTLCDGLVDGNEGFITLYDFDETTVQINEGPRVEYCPNDIKILTASIIDNDFTYEWFKDDVLQPQYAGGVINLPQSNFGGTYTLTITGSETCSIPTAPVEVINLGSDILTRPPPEIMLLPTEPTLILEITTNAPPGSTVEWFRNGISFQSALPTDVPEALSIEVTDTGVYTASVFANDSCPEPLEATTEVFEPVRFRTEIATLLDCDQDADTGTIGLDNLFGVTSTGKEVPITVDQLSLFDFEWFRAGVSTGDTETTISITQDDAGQVYVLDATLRNATFETARSNELIAEIIAQNLEITASSTSIPPGGTVLLTAPQSGSYTYEWFVIVNGENQLLVDGDTIVRGQGTSEIEVSIPGQYFVIISFADCNIESNILTIGDIAGETEIIPNIVTPNNDGINDNWLLPESLFNQQDVEVTIFDARGQVDFIGASYQNNWPIENSRSSGQNPIYYYIITRNNSVIRKGSITVMR